MTDSETKLSIKEWAIDDRPREKMMLRGEEALTTAELLAILIGSGNAEKSAVELMRDILNDCGNKLSRLSRMTIEDLMKYKGIGEAKAITIKAAAEIGRRRAMEKASELECLNSSDKVYEYMRPRMQDLYREEFWILLLNNNSRLIMPKRISTGGLTETSVDLRLILKEAIMANATALIAVHNHPSGSLRPSTDDIRLTARIKEACRIMNIQMLDHIIVTDGSYYSFADEGKL